MGPGEVNARKMRGKGKTERVIKTRFIFCLDFTFLLLCVYRPLMSFDHGDRKLIWFLYLAGIKIPIVTYLIKIQISARSQTELL